MAGWDDRYSNTNDSPSAKIADTMITLANPIERKTPNAAAGARGFVFTAQSAWPWLRVQGTLTCR